MATKPKKSKAAPKRATRPAKARSARASSRQGKGTGKALGTRPLWSGNIRLALVSVPVKVYPATASGARISFHQVHEPSGKRIRYEKVVPGIGPVNTEEIVKGYDLGRGNYVLIDPEEIDALKLETSHTINLVQFVKQNEIDPIWFDRPYYVVADGELAEEAYTVLREALRRSGRLGLGQFVMRGREYVAALKPCGRGLLLETLRFDDEVREAASFFVDIPDEEPDEELLDLANELIERKSEPFSPERFKDSYTEAVRELVEAKAKHRKPVQVEEEEVPSGGAKVIDLVEALKRSVKSAKQTESSGGGRGGASKRKAG